MKNKKVIFIGTTNFSVEILKQLILYTNVVAVVTKPDTKVGRKQILTPSDVKQFALENSIKVFTPIKLKDEVENILSLKPDIIITCDYGKIIPKQIIDYPEYGCINIHPSLLPKYRGSTPINTAIKNGDDKTGITIMYMDETLDTGDIIKQKEVEINFNDNVFTLKHRLASISSSFLIEVLPLIFNKENGRIKQDESLSSLTKQLTKEDELITFNDKCINIYNLIRSMNPTPGCYFTLNNNRIKIIECKIGNEINEKYGIITNINKDSINISCSDKELIITKIKPEGKKEMLVRDYLNGINIKEIKGEKVNV